VELERVFRDDRDNLAVIQTLAEELTHRKTAAGSHARWSGTPAA